MEDGDGINKLSPFFDSVYLNYNKIWQEIIKLEPYLNGDFVLYEVSPIVVYIKGIELCASDDRVWSADKRCLLLFLA